MVQAVKTGEILACASYPTYDLSTYNRDFKELSEDPYKPLYDRALLAEYAPGSIYKMVTAIAAIDMGHIGEYYEITDEGRLHVLREGKLHAEVLRVDKLRTRRTAPSICRRHWPSPATTISMKRAA